MAGYTLTSLMPEPFIVHDPVTKRRYDGKMAAAFGVEEQARYRRLIDELTTAMAVVNDAQSSPDDAAAAGAIVDAVVDDLIAAIVPAMPEERRVALTFEDKYGLLDAWRAAQPVIDPKAPAPPKTMRGRRSSG